MTRPEQDRTKSPVVTCLALAALILAAALLVSFLFPGSMAGSQTMLVTDYSSYPDTPQAQLPPGCDGGGLYQSQQYSLNGGAPVDDPKQLPDINAGDTITMTWDATTPQCVGAPIVLDVKVSQHPTFEPGDDQQAYIPYAITTADGGPGSLSFTFPPLAEFGFGCAYQFDAIVGLPLAIVGPSGSDYSASVRGDDRRTTLIGYRNGAYVTCAAEQTTTTSTTAPESTTTTSTVPAATTSTPVPSTVPAVTEDTTPTCAPVQQVDGQSLSPAAAACVLSGDTTVETSGEDAPSAGVLPASTQRHLANTGADADLWIAAAILLFCFGWLAHINTEGRS